ATPEQDRLARVVDVSQHQRHRDARQHSAVQKLVVEAEHEATQRVDQKQLDQVVHREPEEAIDVAPYEPAHAPKPNSLRVFASALGSSMTPERLAGFALFSAVRMPNPGDRCRPGA